MTIIKPRNMFCQRLFISLCLLASIPAFAQAPAAGYPNRPIKFIVPYAAGGATDVLARVTAEEMSKSLGQPIVIDNRPGAGVVVGSGMVAKAPADGYTFLVTTSAHSINQTLFRKLPYDSDKDFEPVGMIGKVSFVLLVTPKLDVSDVKSFVALMRANSAKYSFGSAGVGSPMHVGPELFKNLTAINATHIPYKGESAALNDLLGGQITFMYSSPSTAAQHIRSGAVRPLAITSPRRSPLLPNVPTMAEAGYPEAETYSWIVLMAPANTPREIVDLMNREIGKALSNNEVRARMGTFGFDVEARLTPAETRQFIHAEALKWGPIVKASGAVTD